MTEQKEGKIVPLRFNYMFKSIFADYNDTSFLTALISSFLGVPYEKLKGKVTLLNGELSKENKEDHGMTVDVLVQLENGDYINIEMNCYDDGPERNISYLARIYEKQFKVGKKYRLPKKCIQLNFNTFGNGEYATEEYMLRTSYGKILTDTFQVYNIDIEKCKSKCYNIVNEVEKWGKLIMIDTIDLLKMELTDIEMPEELREKLKNRIEELSSDESLALLYDEEERDRYGREMEKLRAEKRGLDQGIEEGKNLRTLELAKKLKEHGMALTEISIITGLTESELLNL